MSNMPVNKLKNSKIDVNFDVEVVDYVRKNRFIRRSQLIDYIIKSHGGERGYTRPSVERKLARLTKIGSLVIVKQPELEKYGIYEKNKNASYLSLEEIVNLNDYLDTLFSYFESNDPDYDKNSILNEIDLYTDRYSLTREQLDVLVNYLYTNDEKLLLHIIRILNEYIIDRNITPTNKDPLLKSYSGILAEFAGKSKTLEGYRRGVIFVLGHYNDDSIIDWLKEDLKSLKDENTFNTIKEDYGNVYTARVIDKHKLELFNLINQLKKEGKQEEARLVYNVKHEVAKILGHIKEKEANF